MPSSVRYLKQKEWQKKMKSQGRCTVCTKPLNLYKHYCDEHARMNRERVKKWYHNKKSKIVNQLNTTEIHNISEKEF